MSESPLIPPAVESIRAEFAPLLRQLQVFAAPATFRVALDVGSRDALASMEMSRAFPSARIYAFECNPPAVELCRRNTAGEPRITVVDRAVSDTNGELTFHAIDPARTVTPHADGNIGASSLLLASPEYPHEQYVQQAITVQSTTLQTWAAAAGVSAIDLLWMDLQGAELRALAGLGDLIGNVRFLYTEVEYKPMYLGQPLAAEMYAFIEKAGFVEVAVLHRDEWMGNVLFRRREIKPRTIGGRLREAKKALRRTLRGSP